jgi:metal-responsive CopG/Arc/MetJ family transcriptional regulator
MVLIGFAFYTRLWYLAFMPTEKPKILIVVDDSLLERLDNYRRQSKRIPSKSEAVRILLDEALKEFEKKRKSKISLKQLSLFVL